MTFLAATRLWLLVLPALLAAAYLAVQFRRPKYAVRFTNVELLDKVAPDRPGWRRHATALALLAALTALVAAIARPARAVEVPREEATVVLALDVSLSMGADDVAPTRIDAAQQAAQDFVEAVPDELRIGLVAFSGNAALLVPPTTERAPLLRAVDNLQLGEGTAIGEAVFTALDALVFERPDAEELGAAIVLLSDGETTVGRPDEAAAAEAVRLGVPVSTVAFGTDRGFVVYQGETIPVPINEAALAAVAEATGGQAFTADTADELTTILEGVGAEVGFETEQREIADWFTGLGLLLAAAAAAGSMFWFSRLP